MQTGTAHNKLIRLSSSQWGQMAYLQVVCKSLYEYLQINIELLVSETKQQYLLADS